MSGTDHHEGAGVGGPDGGGGGGLNETRPPDESVYDRLNWRQSREESLSDWTIHVVTSTRHLQTASATVATTPTTTTIADMKDSTPRASSPQEQEQEQQQQHNVVVYHVHKHVLAVGPRKSEYFVRVFQENGRFAESQNSTSRIELHELAAKCFPQLLDYMYYYPNTSVPATTAAVGGGDDEELSSSRIMTTQTVTALHSLADYFEIARLSWDTSQFWQKDINDTTCATYYEHALMLQNDILLQAARQYCFENIMAQAPGSSQLTKVAEPEFWLALLQQKKEVATLTITDHFSRHVSALVVESCHCNRDSWTSEIFQTVTDEEYLPYIHPNAALTLLDLERHFGRRSQENDASKELSSLQKRCVEALATNSSHIILDNDDDDSTMLLLSKQSPLVLAKLCTRSRFVQNDAKEKLIQERDQAKTAFSVQLGRNTRLVQERTIDVYQAIKVALEVEQIIMEKEKKAELDVERKKKFN